MATKMKSTKKHQNVRPPKAWPFPTPRAVNNKTLYATGQVKKNIRDMNGLFEFYVALDELSKSDLLALAKKLNVKTVDNKGKALPYIADAIYEALPDDDALRDNLLELGISDTHSCFIIKVPSERKYTKVETESGMLLEFHDSDGKIFNDEFDDWRRNHPEGYLLSFISKKRAKLHEALGCWHMGMTAEGYVTVEGDISRTSKRKVCAVSLDKLLSWADTEGVSIERCTHCFKDRPIPTYVSTQKHLVKEESIVAPDIAELPLTVQAIEGVLREIKVITKSRDGALRKAAIENAQGVCAACGVNYSRVLGGLGQRVLQVHHRRQLALLDEPQVNSIEDLAVVCANCHQMIHADMAHAITVEDLRKRLRNDAFSKTR